MEPAGQCHICIRECARGESFCGRRDRSGRLKYPERICSMKIDHLSDKPVTHFGKNSRVLSIGSWGCNLRCEGCQNAALSWNRTGDNLGFIDMKPESIVAKALLNNCKGICYTFNEPAILLESVERTARMARENGLFNVLVTNSTLTESSVGRISPYINAVAADIKSLGDDFYIRWCGAKEIKDVAQRILICIRKFHEYKCHVEVRTNIIPGANDSLENYHGIASWIKDNLGRGVPWHLTRFFPAHNLSHLAPTSVESLLSARDAGLMEGLENVHTYLEKGCDCASDLIPHEF